MRSLDRKSFLPRLPIRILSRSFRSICRFNLLTKFIFNVNVHPHPFRNCPNWDLTTLALKKSLNRFVRDDLKILEIGTGPIAVLTIYIAKRKKVKATAVDVNPAFIENALKCVKRNEVSVKLIQSDLFSNVNGYFDIVFFNPPYLPRRWVMENDRKLLTGHISDRVWDGGLDGSDTIRCFLKGVVNVIHGGSIIMLGANSFFVDRLTMKELIKESNLKLITIVASRFNPSDVYVLTRIIHNPGQF